MYLHSKNELSRSRLSKVRTCKQRDTDRYATENITSYIAGESDYLGGLFAEGACL